MRNRLIAYVRGVAGRRRIEGELDPPFQAAVRMWADQGKREAVLTRERLRQESAKGR
jgi:hypothetical protein